MPTDLATVHDTATDALAALTPIAERAQEFAANAKANNTVRAYRADWADFEVWCSAHTLACLPATADTVALYLTDLASSGRKVSTLTRRLSSISQAHQLAGHDSPTSSAKVRTVFAGIRRTVGAAQTGKAPALVEDVRAMVATLGGGLLAVRDRALLLVGFAGAFRRSELVGLDVGDLEFAQAGIVVTIRRSKTDQEGEGRRVGVPYGHSPETCPVTALRAWLDASGIEAGPVFRSVNRRGHVVDARLSDKAVALVVKRTATAAGLDAERFAGHSLRSGLATSAAAAGADERSIMAQTGHRSTAMVRRYIRDGNVFRSNAAKGLL